MGCTISIGLKIANFVKSLNFPFYGTHQTAYCGVKRRSVFRVREKLSDSFRDLPRPRFDSWNHFFVFFDFLGYDLTLLKPLFEY